MKPFAPQLNPLTLPERKEFNTLSDTFCVKANAKRFTFVAASFALPRASGRAGSGSTLASAQPAAANNLVAMSIAANASGPGASDALSIGPSIQMAAWASIRNPGSISPLRQTTVQKRAPGRAARIKFAKAATAPPPRAPQPSSTAPWRWRRPAVPVAGACAKTSQAHDQTASCRHTRTNTKHIPANRNIKLQLVGFHPTSVVNRKVVSRLCDHSALNDRAGACHV